MYMYNNYRQSLSVLIGLKYDRAFREMSVCSSCRAKKRDTFAHIPLALLLSACHVLAL